MENDERNVISLDAPCLDGNERKYLNECIDTNWVSWQGKFVVQTEDFLSKYCGTRHALAVVNGTYALMMALQALEIGSEDEVIVPVFTMSASAFTVTAVGAKVVWVDCSPSSLVLDVDDVAAKVTKKTKAIIAVHLYGHSVDMVRLMEVADYYNIPVIEDVAEALGAKCSGKRVGGLGTIACHSFHNKIVASGEGGAITLNDDILMERLKHLHTPSPNNFSNELISMNNRMSNISAAVALGQLERINNLIERRKKVASLYEKYFKEDNNLSLFPVRDNEDCVYWRYTIAVNDNSTLSRDELVDALKKKNIEARQVFALVTDHPHYKASPVGTFKNAERVAATALDLPSSPNLTEVQVHKVISNVQELIK